ncbi:hypothetical protein DEA8626_03773 [Defluviimonas aquaemixtae]|uniref:Hedgehog/Intein (Hint) domain-containing protein n=1 Tax=Albidovulum aquaemixtae TaxID=1542388 RepID=A0A2R8BMS1_9RHOB|nr:Hint domain-containing protein [Defluviimonas aquaemixtae]SPH24735.1 hypothetical protein DEA8626_03773 [Defluviimonas aquaemixtae]
MAEPYISEIKPRGLASERFLEVRVDEGTYVGDVRLVFYDYNGTARSTIGLGEINSTENGSDIYLISGPDSPLNIQGVRGYALVQGTTVLQFTSFEREIAATDGLAVSETSVSYPAPPQTSSIQSDDGGATYYTQSNPNPGQVPPVCFAAGTMIRTPNGERAVETLRVGDLVSTLDHGAQEIRFIHTNTQPLEFAAASNRPVLIQAGALGPCLPANDLIVSPQHRMLVGGRGQLQNQFKAEALAPAKSLTSLHGIRHMRGKREMTWVHFACDAHEVIFADGCLSESLLLGPMVLKGLAATVRSALIDTFGAASAPDAALNGPPARRCLSVGAVRRLLAKGAANKAVRLGSEIRKWDADLEREMHEAGLVSEFRLMHQSCKGMRLAV